MMVENNMRLFELYELIEVICEEEIIDYKINQGYDLNNDLEDSELEEILYNICDINIEQLEIIIERLLPLCQIAKSELSGKLYQGFGKNNIWIIKKEV